MKKTMAYAATAILLGIAIMMLPKALEIQPTTPASQPTDFAETNLPIKGEDRSETASYGLGSQPSNLLPSSLIFFSGLIVAVSIYVTLKKRIV